MEMKKISHYAAPVLLAIFIFSSDFLQTDLFKFGENDFAVWFVMSVLCFASGWYINKSLGWNFGGKVVFATIIAVTIISIFTISFFNEYFGASELLSENLILFSLRNIMLGSMAFFGMAIEEILTTKRDSDLTNEKIRVYESILQESKKQSDLELKAAQLKAKEIIFEAESQAKNIILQKERIERELKEFIQTEKELIKKYEQQ
ncbi:MAG TPA: hypothetical protein PKA80_08045 [Ignavibacteriaceae bacterium]|nr:hypothetical protein [Ignavibacteriaceae bacterium]